MAQLPQIVIVGRPNVGKSTLFNRILGRRQAIVGEQSGLTRDRHIARCDWRGREFELSDTGGVEWRHEDGLARVVEEHALAAVEGATLVLFVVDGREGLVAVESDLADVLRRSGVPIFLVVNKCDAMGSGPVLAADFAVLGFDQVFPIAADQGDGVADVLDAMFALLPEERAGDRRADDAIRVAVVGRPNVGKSSLVNAMLGTERLVVSDVSGTTRDAIDTRMTFDGRDYVLVDTAGIRRGARQEGFAEHVSVMIARRRMDAADVALLVIDAEVGLSRQDRAVADEAQAAGCGLILVVNKWDKIEVERGNPRSWGRELRERLGRMRFAVISFVSALTGEGVPRLFPLIDRVAADRLKRVPTSELNTLFERLRDHGPQGPPGSPELKYVTQAAVAPPTFVLFAGRGRTELPASFIRFWERQLREHFEFEGVPLRIHVRRRKRRE